MQTVPSVKLVEQMMSFVIKQSDLNSKLTQIGLISEITFISGLAEDPLTKSQFNLKIENYLASNRAIFLNSISKD